MTYSDTLAIGRLMSDDAQRKPIQCESLHDERVILESTRQKAVDRLRSKWANALLIHTPIHASWLNQIEMHLPPHLGQHLLTFSGRLRHGSVAA
jgi:hypothetical protein